MASEGEGLRALQVSADEGGVVGTARRAGSRGGVGSTCGARRSAVHSVDGVHGVDGCEPGRGGAARTGTGRCPGRHGDAAQAWFEGPVSGPPSGDAARAGAQRCPGGREGRVAPIGTRGRRPAHGCAGRAPSSRCRRSRDPRTGVGTEPRPPVPAGPWVTARRSTGYVLPGARPTTPRTTPSSTRSCGRMRRASAVRRISDGGRFRIAAASSGAITEK